VIDVGSCHHRERRSEAALARGGRAWSAGVQLAVSVEASHEPNLDGASADRQLRRGVASLGIGMALSVAFLHLGADTRVRTLVFVPLFLGLYGVISGMTGTCGLRALLGVRQTREGSEPVADQQQRRQLRRRGYSVLVAVAAGSLAATAALTMSG
jgi:hypothetical protein